MFKVKGGGRTHLKVHSKVTRPKGDWEKLCPIFCKGVRGKNLLKGVPGGAEKGVDFGSFTGCLPVQGQTFCLGEFYVAPSQNLGRIKGFFGWGKKSGRVPVSFFFLKT